MADTDDTDLDTEDPRDAEPPRGHTSLLTIILIVLNILAVFAFSFLLAKDVLKRQEWTSAVFLRDLANNGLLTDETDVGTDPQASVHPRYYLDPPLLREAFKERGGRLTEKDKFVEVNENFRVNITYADLDEHIVARYFKDAGVPGPVKTLKDEIERVKGELPGLLDNAVNEKVVDKADKALVEFDKAIKDGDTEKAEKISADLRALLRKILFPLCTDGNQVVYVYTKGTADALVVAMNKLNISIPDEDAFRQAADAKFKQLQGKVAGWETLEPELKKLLAAQKVVIDDAVKPNFERAADMLLRWNAVKVLDMKIAEMVPRLPKKDEPQKIVDQAKAKFKPFLHEAAKRRLLFDILQPMEVYRPTTDKLDTPDPAKPLGYPKFPTSVVSRAGDLENVSVDDLWNHFVKRCSDVLVEFDWLNPQLQRDNAEKRRCVAFLLLAVSQPQIPGGTIDITALTEDLVKGVGQLNFKIDDEPGFRNTIKDRLNASSNRLSSSDVVLKELTTVMDEFKVAAPKDPDNPDAAADRRPLERMVQRAFVAHSRSTALPGQERRAEVVCGLRDFTQACEDLSVVTDILNKQTRQAIDFDIGNFHLTTANAIGFSGQYNLAVEKLKNVASILGKRQDELTRLQKSRAAYDEQLKTRTGHEMEIVQQLREARAKTHDMSEELKTLQRQLFQAQIELVGTQLYNQYLLEVLEQIEKQQPKSKGAPRR